MSNLYGAGVFLIILGIIYYLPIGSFLLKTKSLRKAAGIILVLLGILLIFRALTL